MLFVSNPTREFINQGFDCAVLGPCCSDLDSDVHVKVEGGLIALLTPAQEFIQLIDVLQLGVTVEQQRRVV